MKNNMDDKDPTVQFLMGETNKTTLIITFVENTKQELRFKAEFE